jgi:hypothetical protein
VHASSARKKDTWQSTARRRRRITNMGIQTNMEETKKEKEALC